MDEKIKEMIRMAAEDGVITDKEKALIIKKAKDLGEDVDMVELAIEGEIGQLKKEASKIESKGEKCPNCGSIIPPGLAVCPSCGFALTSKKANQTALKLQQDLARLDKRNSDDIVEKKANRIISTVVPNSRGDLLELLAYSSSKANKYGPRDYGEFGAENMSLAYWKLFENCIMLAQVSFADDPSFKQYFQKYNKEKHRKSIFGLFTSLPGYV